MAALDDAITYHPFGSRILRLTVPRLHGTDVKILQHLCNASPTVHGEVPTDGLYGSETARAVQRLQALFEVDGDGSVGPKTYYALGHLTGGYLVNGPEFGSRPLAEGDAGSDVRILQNRLAASGSSFTRILERSPDGEFDLRTTQALLAYQEAIQGLNPGVPVTGTAGPETYDSLWVFSGYGGRTLRRRRKGYDVYCLQKTLTQVGLFNGEEDGFFGPMTEAAVRHLQREAGSTVDGVAGSEVFYHLSLML